MTWIEGERGGPALARLRGALGDGNDVAGLVTTARERAPPRTTEEHDVKTVLKSSDPVAISFAQAMLTEADIASYELDANTSVLEGSIGFFIPRRLAVADSDYETATAVLVAAGVQPFRE